MMTLLSRRPLLLASLTALAALPACSFDMVPGGYSYYNKPYKSPPAPLPKKEDGKPSRPISTTSSAGPEASAMPAAPAPMVAAEPLAPVKEMTPEPMAAQPRLSSEQADQFRMAIYNLAESLTRRAGLPPKTVFIMQPTPSTPLYDMMDENLREAMRHLNYRLSDTPDKSYIVTYAAQPMTAATPRQSAGGPPANTRLSLFVYDKAGEDARLLTEESNVFYIEGAENLDTSLSSLPAPMASSVSVR